MNKYYSTDLSVAELQGLTRRVALNDAAVRPVVAAIISEIKTCGDSALRKYSQQFDGLDCDNYLVSATAITAARETAAPAAVAAMQVAIANIEKFHAHTGLSSFSLETLPGVHCSAKVLPIALVV